MDIVGEERTGLVAEFRQAVIAARVVWLESALGMVRQSKRQILSQVSLMRRAGWEYRWTAYEDGAVVIRGFDIPEGGPRQRRARP